MNRMITLAVAALCVVAGGIWWMTRAPQTPPSLPVGAANAQSAAVSSEIIEMKMGNEDAKVTVIEYASYTCPHCASFHKGPMKQLKTDYIDTGKVHFIYREVYFDRYGLWASLISRCDPQRFFGITDMLYNQQKEWLGKGDPVTIANNLRKIGKVAGLDEDKMESCLADNDQAKALIAWYQANNEKHDVDGTPMFIIDGKKYKNMSFAEFSKVLDEQLAN